MTQGIVVRDLRKTFAVRERMFGPRTLKTAVDGLSFTVPRGRVTGFLGLNGAGKTTTIKILSTLLRPTSGSVTVDGLSTVSDARAVRRRINLIAGGERMVYARMTGRENLRYFGVLYGVPEPVLRERAEELLGVVGLADAADTVVERYSRGMTQRLAIARGLINDPDYLLLDEPTLGLDAPIARDLRKVVARLAADGKGVLLTSHYLAEVEELCEHVHVVSKGRMLAEGSPATITSATGCHGTVTVTVPNPSAAVQTAIADFATRVDARVSGRSMEDGALSITLRHPDDIAGPLVTEIVAAGGTVAGLSVGTPSLEDAILALGNSTAAPAAAQGVPA
ncbi:ABC transporter ATP-binding protein [Streptomyces sp. NPDC059851]|uniref:ABC transporter ATP-binding protein n=1 Tax=Streptomyces sp. NPDC059851 TaxID=3346971 RepID=UPI0036516825